MSTLKLDTLSNKAGTASVPSDTIVSGTAKAGVNFNGTGTVAIRRAFNVSSLTDNGTGSYTINFTNAMSDNNYSFNTGYGDGSSSGTVLVRSTTSYFLTTSLRVETVSTTAYQDVGIVCVGIFS